MKTDDTTKKLVSSRHYQGFSLADVATRAGSLDILKNPSRYGSLLSYPPWTNSVSDARSIGRKK
jgi:hypothetical protein